MKIEINRINNAVHLEAKNEEGNRVLIDGSPEIGGNELGMRPMQLLLASLGSCTSMDLLNILKKQRQIIKAYQVIVEGNREKEGDISIFKKIHLHFILKGDLNKEKVKKALVLSVEKHCSVSRMLSQTAKITYTFEINQ